ncbi:MAG: FecR domain-containing protein, partial [Deltaproteobacteria bacterium]|nr:FecR domain-containing protein [Deltaproteobacteria bacterium]
MMKTDMRRSVSRNFLYWLIVLALTVLSLPLTAHAAQLIGKITRLTGTATIYRVDVKDPIKVSRGMHVHLGDRIKTGAESRLRIELNDGSILSMAENADLNLDHFEFDPKEEKRSASFKMDIGKVRVFAKDLLKFKKKDFKIRTPTAVVGVRGTVFLVWVLSRTITKVVCFENVIQVANILSPDKFIQLTKDLATDIMAGKTPSKPVLMNKDQLRQLKKGFGEIAAATTTVATTTVVTTTE